MANNSGMVQTLLLILIVIQTSFLAAASDIIPSQNGRSCNKNNDHWVTDCEWKENLDGICYKDDGKFQAQNESNGPYWGLGCERVSNHCSIFVNMKMTNFTLTTVIGNNNSYIMVGSVSNHATFPKFIPGNLVWITKVGQSETVINIDEMNMGIIIFVFAPSGEKFGYALIKDLRQEFSRGLQNEEFLECSGEIEEEDEVSTTTEQYKSNFTFTPGTRSMLDGLKGVNLYLITGVTFIIMFLMIVVLISTCIQRRCPPCSKKVNEDDDEVELDEDLLDDELLDQKLRVGLLNRTILGNDYNNKEHKEPIFFSRQIAFGTISGKTVPRQLYYEPTFSSSIPHQNSGAVGLGNFTLKEANQSLRKNDDGPELQRIHHLQILDNATAPTAEPETFAKPDGSKIAAVQEEILIDDAE